MSTSTSPNLSRTARKKGGSKVLPVLLAIVLLAAGAWGVKTYFLDGGQPKNILLMGVDQDKTRTDVVMLAHVDPRQGIVNLISVPRDTWVEIPCEGIKTCYSPDKLAHAHAYGGDQGPELAAKTVEKFLGIKIDGYARVDYEGFKKVIDTLGGVEILIDKDMDYEDPTPPGLYIHFKASKTPQKLNGQKALEYVRFRNDGQGDVGRTERTRKFLYALVESLKKNGKISQLPQLWKDMSPYMTTNIDSGTAAALARVAPKIDPANINMEMIPGKAVILKSGPWVWEADAAKTQALVNNLIVNPKPATAEPKK
ncbi:MAG TPA: LCP family protein [Symbiobacteriaceae bacterium]|nr:LCP family protein [Symbiobacteriaceae bacterium]